MDYLVIEKHETEYPNPIILKAGEKVIIGEEFNSNENWTNWVYCTKTDYSTGGWVPKQLIEYNSATILQDYSAEELNVEKSILIEGITELNGWLWSKNKSTNKTGWIPMEKIQPLPPACY